MYTAKLAIFLIAPLLCDPCTATDQGDAVADDAMADTDVEAEEAAVDADTFVESSDDEAMALVAGGPRWSTQPDKNATCLPGVCGAGKWVAFMEGRTHAECKALCEGARTLVPEPEGIIEKAYKFRQNGRYQDLSKRTPTFERKVPRIQYKSTGGYFDAKFQSAGMRDHFYVRWEGYVEIKKKGKYTFWTRSDDGSRLFIDGTQVVDNPGWHGMRWRDGRVELDAGKHAFWAEVFEGGGGAGMMLYYQGPDTNNKNIVVPQEVLSSSLNSDGKQSFMLKDQGFGDKLCTGFSHQGSKCILYDECSSVGTAVDKIVGDKSADWVGDPAGYQTCQYSQHDPDL